MHNAYGVQAVAYTLPFSIDEVKAHLRLPECLVDSDEQLEGMVIMACLVAENLTHRDIFPRTYTTYRDTLTPGGRWFYPDRSAQHVELRKTPFRRLVSVETLQPTGAYQLEDLTLFRMIDRDEYQYLYPAFNKEMPENVTDPQGVRIIFEAGLADPKTLRADMKTAILNHVAAIYENRGDCDCSETGRGSPDIGQAVMHLLPPQSKLVYRLNKVVNFNGAMFR